MIDWARVKLDTDQNLPYYQQIARKLRAMIVAGELREGERLPPSSELKEIFQVSAITVENAVAELVKEDLVLRRRRLGTLVAAVPSPAAAPAPPAGQTHDTVNVVFNSNRPGGHGYLEMLCEFERVGKGHGFKTRFTINNPDAPDAIAGLTEGCAGVFLMGMPKVELIRELSWRKIPLVVFGDPADSDPELMKNQDNIVHDDADRAFNAVKHLVELGHRRIMAIIAPAGTPFEECQRRGLVRIARAHHLSAGELLVLPVDDYLPEFGYKAAYKTLCAANRPTACMTTDHSLAIGIMKAVHDLGLRVPEDLSLITYGDHFNCIRTEPKLTCFDTAVVEVVRVAWEKLLGQMNDPKHKKSKTVVQNRKLLYGKSTMYHKENPIAQRPPRRDLHAVTS